MHRHGGSSSREKFGGAVWSDESGLIHGSTIGLHATLNAAALPLKSMSSVSVIVPTYNRAKYIGECLDSLLSQSVPAQEIIVVDDGSTDATSAVLANYTGRVRVLRKPNGGKPSAVNLGVAEARGDWLAALGHDPGADFVYAPHLVGRDGHDGRIVPGTCNRPVPPPSEALFLTLMQGCFFHLGTCLFRREAFTALGGLDPELVTGEDYDFQIRLAAQGRAVYADEPVFVFRQHDGVRGPSGTRYAASERARVFRRFSQAIGQKIRLRYSLGDYLVPRSKPLTTEQRRCALLERAIVMANHGCIDEMVQDLLEVLSVEGLALGDTEIGRIEVLMQTGWAYSASRSNWRVFKAAIARLHGRTESRRVVMALARGTYRLARGHPAPVAERISRLCGAGELALIALTASRVTTS
jgi:GT2 family glycosyltransferase